MYQFAQRAIFACTLFVVLTWMSAGLDAALIGHWSLDDTAASTTVIDSTGATNGTLTCAGNTSAISSAGKVGNAFHFDGSNDYVITADNNCFDVGTGDFTLTAWINMDCMSGSSFYTIMTKNTYNDDFHWRISESNNRQEMYISGAVFGGSTLSAGTWYQVMFTRTSGTGQLYLNGATDGSSGSITNSICNNYALEIGARRVGTQFHFDGLIDDSAMWNEALTADEVKGYYDVSNHACVVYNAGQFDCLKQVHDASSGNVKVGETVWEYTTGMTCAAGLTITGGEKRLVLNAAGCTGLIGYDGLYWDDNGSTSGATCGTTAPDVWSSASTKWSANCDGTSTSRAWLPCANAYFSAGSDATGSYCITVCGNQSVGSLNFQEGCVTLTGGTITLGGCSARIDVSCGRNATIVSTLAGTGGYTKTGGGTVTLTGSITLTGDINLNAGTISRTGAWCICNGDTHTVRCGADLLTSTNINIGRCTTGTLTVTGCGSTASNTADSIIVGRNCGSNGTLNVLSQADVSATSFLFVGRCSGSVGVVNIDGSGSTLTVGCGVRLGRDSSGANTINVTNCGRLSTCSSFIIGQLACASGTLNVSSGGEVSMTTFNIGSGCGSSGTVTLCGAGSKVCATGTVSIGRSAGGSTASLTLNTGSQITAPTITVFSGGSLNVNADELVANTTDINFNGGTLNLAANVEETVDAVTLSASSAIAYNADADLTMTDFSMTAGQVLSITGWTNWTRYGSGQGLGTSFRVDNSVGTYDKTNISVNGSTGVFDFMNGGDGYYYLVLTTPEPSTYFGISGLLFLIGIHWVRRGRVVTH